MKPLKRTGLGYVKPAFTLFHIAWFVGSLNMQNKCTDLLMTKPLFHYIKYVLAWLSCLLQKKKNMSSLFLFFFFSVFRMRRIKCWWPMPGCSWWVKVWEGHAVIYLMCLILFSVLWHNYLLKTVWLCFSLPAPLVNILLNTELNWYWILTMHIQRYNLFPGVILYAYSQS